MSSVPRNTRNGYVPIWGAGGNDTVAWIRNRILTEVFEEAADEAKVAAAADIVDKFLRRRGKPSLFSPNNLLRQ